MDTTDYFVHTPLFRHSLTTARFSSPLLSSRVISRFTNIAKFALFRISPIFWRVFSRATAQLQKPSQLGWFDNYIYIEGGPGGSCREGWLAFCSSKPGHEGFNATRGFMRYSIKRVGRHRSIKSSPRRADRLGREISAVTSPRRLFRTGWSRHRDWQPRRFHFKYESRSPLPFRLRGSLPRSAFRSFAYIRHSLLSLSFFLNFTIFAYTIYDELRLRNTRSRVFKERSCNVIGKRVATKDKLTWSFAIKGPSTFHFNSSRTRSFFSFPLPFLITTSIANSFSTRGKVYFVIGKFRVI